MDVALRPARTSFSIPQEMGTMGDRYDGGEGGATAFPEALFHAFAGNGGARPRVHGGFRLVAAPGQALRDPLRPGDVLIRRIAGDGYVHVAFAAGADVLPLHQALARGWRVESPRPGGYVVVVEAGARPHRRADAFARRLLDPSGRVPPGQLIVRPVRDPREAEDAGWSEDDPPRKRFLIISGGPGVYDSRDPAHDQAWSSYVDPPLLKSVRMQAGKRTIVKFWEADEQVVWLVYRPAYQARWTDDVARKRSEPAGLKKEGFKSYVDLLEKRAAARGWTLKWMDDAGDLWKVIRQLPKGSISRVWYYGHARDDLWLTLAHDAGGVAVQPESKALLEVATVARKTALADRFAAAPSTHTAARTHRFVGCNTAAYAKAWAAAFGQWTEGFEGTIDFSTVHTTPGYEPSTPPSCTLKRYGTTGDEEGEEAAETWLELDAVEFDAVESAALASSAGWGGGRGGVLAAEAWQPDESASATLLWTESPEDDRADAARKKAWAEAKRKADAEAKRKAEAEVKKAQAEAERLAKELQPYFLDQFSSRPARGKRIPFGAKIGTRVSIVAVGPGDWLKRRQEEAERMAKRVEPLYLKFAPERVAQKLVEYYRVSGQPFPADRLKVIDENTRLTSEERGAIFSVVKALTMTITQEEADKADGFWSATTNRIFLKSDSVTAGAVAHEMAHAYTDGAWDDLIVMMLLRGMKNADKLSEGMTVVMADRVVAEWFRAQPSGTTYPSTGYDATYTAVAREFIKAVGDERALQAYFAGEVDFDPARPPEDSLVIGKDRKAWKWPWR
jgi:hypothetical protein